MNGKAQRYKVAEAQNIGKTLLNFKWIKEVSKAIFLIWTGLVCFLGAIFAQELQVSKDNIQAAESYYLKGKEYILKEDYHKADQAFKKAQALLEGAATINIEDVKLEGLISPEKEVQRVSKPKAESVKSIKNEGDILSKAKEAYLQGKLDEALNLYSQALLVYPDNYNFHYNLGVIYLKKLDYLSALKKFETVISLNSRDANAYYNLGIIYENFLNDKKKALSCYEKYLKFTPSGKEKETVKAWVEFIKSETKK